MLALYAAPGTVALAPDIALREAGADFELRLLDFAAGEQRGEAYLGVNPKGRVPALVTEAGILTETPAILTWIAAQWPEKGLAPAEAWGAARMLEAMTYYASTLHVAHAHRMRGHRWADREESWADMAAKIPQTMGEAFAQAQSRLEGPWVMGERFTVADPYLFTVTRWLEGDGLALADFPGLAAHRARMLERPATLAALEAQGLRRPPRLG